MSVNKKYKIGLTFGVFDSLHIGHINLLRRAKQKCDIIIVCVSTDEYSLKYKNKKPIISFKDRVEIVKSIKYVDKVGEQTLKFGKKEAIKKYKPDVLFVGSDWNKNTYTGEGLGVPVKYLKHTDGISSTILKNKLNKFKWSIKGGMKMELSGMDWSGFFCSCGSQIEVSAIAVDTEGTVYLKGECLEEDKDIVLKITFQELMKLAFNKGSNGSIRSLD